VRIGKFYSSIAAGLFVLFLGLVCVPSRCDPTDAEASTVVRTIMNRSLARCYSKTTDGVNKISWAPPTNEDFIAILALGEAAVPPLVSYLDLDEKNGFTQLLAVKFLIAVNKPSVLRPLERATAADQWEVTRAQALAGLFQVSKSDARTFVDAALHDPSPIMRQRAEELIRFYTEDR
jgi:hypothetical protein